MKLVAIYNSFADSTELLPYSLDCIRGSVDGIIIVYQDVSNFGEEIPYPKLSQEFCTALNLTYIKYTPDLTQNGTWNETKKRNIGLNAAKDSKFSDFLFLDNDEMYEDFTKAKKQYIDSGSNGSVCQIYTYFKLPTLRFENIDNYFVPFIHKLQPNTKAGNQGYPFHVDPTRNVNESNVILIQEKMHHFSYVRKNIEIKLNNSSAKKNIEKSNIFKDYLNAKEGYYVHDFFQQKLILVPNRFNIEI